jgi:hypothetical protein
VRPPDYASIAKIGIRVPVVTTSAAECPAVPPIVFLRLLPASTFADRVGGKRRKSQQPDRGYEGRCLVHPTVMPPESAEPVPSRERSTAF